MHTFLVTLKFHIVLKFMHLMHHSLIHFKGNHNFYLNNQAAQFPDELHKLSLFYFPYPTEHELGSAGWSIVLIYAANGGNHIFLWF